MLNKWIGVGRLTKNPEVKTSGETTVAKYSLAIDRKYSKGEEKQTDFISCVCFGKTAEFAEKYLHKGMKIIVVGRIQTGSYTNKEGQKIYTTDIVVEEHEFCESKTESDSAKSNNADDSFMHFNSTESSLPF